MERVKLPFADREEAGRVLAGRLQRYRGQPGPIAVGLARGGVPVAWQISEVLGADLDVLVVRKLGVPGREELAMGAIASGGVRFLNPGVIDLYGVSPDQVATVVRREEAELRRREELYREDRPPADVRARTVFVVDDGLATGASMRVAVRALRQRQPSRLVVAVPVAPLATVAAFRDYGDEVEVLATPEPFGAVGAWYEDFSPTTDEDVRRILARGVARRQPIDENDGRRITE